MELRMDEFEELKCGVYALSCSSRARAELIVNAVNSHEALVGALELAVDVMESVWSGEGHYTNQEEINKVSAALAAAKGGSHD